jgi:hypothetical protein
MMWRLPSCDNSKCPGAQMRTIVIAMRTWDSLCTFQEVLLTLYYGVYDYYRKYITLLLHCYVYLIVVHMRPISIVLPPDLVVPVPRCPCHGAALVGSCWWCWRRRRSPRSFYPNDPKAMLKRILEIKRGTKPGKDEPRNASSWSLI